MGFRQLAWRALFLAGCVSAIDFNINNNETIKKSATVEFENLLVNGVLDGTLSPINDSGYPEGMLYSSLIPYWSATGNATYNSLILMRMESVETSVFNATWKGADVPTSEYVSWGLAAMAAADVDFPFPGDRKKSAWVFWAMAVGYKLDMIINRGAVCDGGLYDDESQKNGTEFDWFSNGAYFQLVSRIALAFPPNKGTFINYADNAWSWSEKNGMVNTTDWTVSQMVSNTTTVNGSTCTAVDTSRWSYAYGLYLSGAAHMYNVTGSDTWRTRTEGLLNSTLDTFFVNNILVEVGNGSASVANHPSIAFKGFLALCLASVANLIPDMADQIVPLLKDTAVAVAEQCDGSSNQTVCGSDWGNSTYNNDPSFGNTWNAANVFTSYLLTQGNLTTGA
ncbi:hypothetical protein BO70DRAFT_400231 [Aspergillus heteromorphus CBS 117.55]|uniref:mannan endo-1,6-alpha-mannosidase n=1 Tax=Aspergillus heteromorphus CBS 117.55 TaxID=1448321 RepID=A0A317V6Z4_9EURO|nr:uncharacterized protein BO70DRAFT_400231 [Aspergillus heteromorphus CBS 117.55]PWY68602.1 hypothetical protein BO70DRAFT_400231 [Aspergillus heteromorphus CBS 117.55]